LDINVSDTVCFRNIPDVHKLICYGDIGKVIDLFSDGDSESACNGYLNPNDTLNSNTMSKNGCDDQFAY